MEIVLENPSVVPLSARASSASASASSSSSSSSSPSAAMTTITQLGLPMHHSHHFPHRAALYDGAGAPLLPAEDYYARNRHGLMSSYDHDLDGASLPMTVRRIDKSGLLEIAEADPAMCPRPRVLTGAEDIAGRSASLRVDRTGLLEAVPEAVDQPEEYYNNNDGVSIEYGTATATTLATAATTATTSTFGEVAEVASRGEASKADADVSPRAFDGACCPLERPSALEGEACPDEVSASDYSADMSALTVSSRTQFDISKATERLPHFSPFSPVASTLRRSWNDNSSKGTSSPSTGRCADADSIRLRNQKSPEFAAKYTPVNSALRNIANRQSQSAIAIPTSDYPSAVSFLASPIARALTTTAASMSTTSPVTRRQQSQVGGCARENLDPASTDSDGQAVDAIGAARESLLAKGSAKQQNNDLPGEERAEAEGCERTAAEGLEEDEVSFKGSNKLLDNDNVQTLRVIILSEQL